MGLSVVYKFICMLLFYVLFLRSFFPIRNGLSGFSEHSDFSLEFFNKNATHRPDLLSALNPPIFKKMVFVLIDALRADFVFSEKSPMTSLQNLLTNGKALRYIARVHPPTVTLPRIKALMTGSIPGFVDVVLNFGSTELLEDNIIEQMRRAKKRVKFYGDEVWIKLFPHHFVESDGTTSFFVTDYTEVDNNVTRHVLPTLRTGQYDVMILHYTGLDHIGHMAGPTSPLIPPKLAEMDAIIKDIYEHVEQDKEAETLVVVSGDHGMSDQGGHGGTTQSETKVPLLLLSPKFTPHKGDVIREVDQIDVAPTLSMLLSLPIPKNNLGVVIDDALVGCSTEEKMMMLWRNGLQVTRVLEYNSKDWKMDEGYLEFQRLSKVHHDWLLSKTSGVPQSIWLSEGDRIGRQYTQAMKTMTRNISSSLTQYDIYSLVISVVTLWLILVTIAVELCLSSASYGEIYSRTVVLYIPVTLMIFFGHMMVCTTSPSSQLCHTDGTGVLLQVFILAVVCWSVKDLVVKFLQFWSVRKSKEGSCDPWGVFSPLGVVLTLGTIIHTLSLLSSSYVEEEHQTWYFYTVTIHLLILVLILCSHTSQGYFRQVCKSACNPKQTYNTYGTDYRESGQIEKQMELEKEEKHSNQVTGFPGHPLMATIFVLFLCRVLRTWNQTGNKWLDRPDVGDWLLRPENKSILSVLVGGSLTLVAMVKWAGQTYIQRSVFVVGLCCIYWYRVSTAAIDNPFQLLPTYNETRVAQLGFLFTGMCIVHPCVLLLRGSQDEGKPNTDVAVSFGGSFQSACILVVLLLGKPHNVVTFVMVVIQEHLIQRMLLHHIALSTTDVTLYYFWMGMAAFFYQECLNPASIWCKASFGEGKPKLYKKMGFSPFGMGVAGHHRADSLESFFLRQTLILSQFHLKHAKVKNFSTCYILSVIIACLMTLSTYGGPLFWLVSLVKCLTTSVESHTIHSRLKTTVEGMCRTLCWTRALPLAVYSTLVTLQRHHLFVWTVFSPKLLYEGVLTLLIAVLSIVCLCLVKFES
ncbi:GPI ethanolamine phosphate transferase 2-like [Ylistrum balloti]|uniref:GPI ethanolamine phosphate transferase 2-like n=1 Tax=Ylistrum balloti TaxID=509963 RepID=UPI002905C383|nr:GPI ethanolamine phosphate transferase 2-like [Ylistrum balloti]